MLKKVREALNRVAALTMRFEGGLGSAFLRTLAAVWESSGSKLSP
jgi:hypothetical protein